MTRAIAGAPLSATATTLLRHEPRPVREHQPSDAVDAERRLALEPPFGAGDARASRLGPGRAAGAERPDAREAQDEQHRRDGAGARDGREQARRDEAPRAPGRDEPRLPGAHERRLEVEQELPTGLGTGSTQQLLCVGRGGPHAEDLRTAGAVSDRPRGCEARSHGAVGAHAALTRRNLLERTAFGAVSIALLGSCGESALPAPRPLAVPAGRDDHYLRGVNCYTLNYASRCEPASSYRYLAARGHRIVRLPFQWGAVQPLLGGPLDPAFLRLLRREVAAVGRAGMRVILDVHSGGRHPDVVQATATLGASISQDQFNDVWLRLSDVFRTDRRVYAYDLMNEPYDLADEVWQGYSQGVVAALRARGDRTLVWIEGNEYASAGAWREHQPRPWIDDPADRHVYSAHCYPGMTSEEPQRAPTAADQKEFLDDLRVFADWLAEHDVRGSIGEVGWPSAQRVGATGGQEWNRLGDAWYSMADESRLDVTYFGASSAYDNWLWAYNGSDNGLHLPGLRRAESQAAVIEAHPSAACAPRCRAPAGQVKASWDPPRGRGA